MLVNRTKRLIQNNLDDVFSETGFTAFACVRANLKEILFNEGKNEENLNGILFVFLRAAKQL